MRNNLQNPGITQAEVCRITGLDKGAVAERAGKDGVRDEA